MLNLCTFEGFLSSDPETKRTKSGLTICNITVAVDKSRKTGNAEKDKPLFLRVTLFGAQAESVAKFFHKGRAIIVSGTLCCDVVDDTKRIGEKREFWYLLADRFDFPITNGKRDEEGQPIGEPKPAIGPKPKRETVLDDDAIVADDELPF